MVEPAKQRKEDLFALAALASEERFVTVSTFITLDYLKFKALKSL